MASSGARRPLGPAAEHLREVIRRLRAPGGCPWDREQTVDSVRHQLLEEVYEVLEALDGDGREACEELGDLLFQIAFLSELFAERGAFDLADVAAHAAEKMVARHPHVFADLELKTAEEVRRHWQELKAQARGESPGVRSVLAGVPRALPALARARELQERAGQVGFDWPQAADVLAKLREELVELEAALSTSPDAVAEELGDVLLVLANLGRKLGVDPEEALQRANAKFIRRFTHVEQALSAAGKQPRQATLEEMDAHWREAKRRGL